MCVSVCLLLLSFVSLKSFLAFRANTPTQAESQLHSLERAAGDISLHVNPNKTEYMSFNRREHIYSLNGGPLKFVDKFSYLEAASHPPEMTSTRDKQKHGQLIIAIVHMEVSPDR